ncbi:MAG: mobile mystery protein A [Prevotellaceae bacterium]|jgi:predicted DNA-binding mobile mystery protein A|nr:mobile mystery protein A [Prevotellaceae bacterium]
MNTSQQKLLILQTDKKLHNFSLLKNAAAPPSGWIRTIRSALKMSLRQLGERMGIAAQSVQQMELREADGNITLNTLREMGKALNMTLVYGFVPNEGSLDKTIEKQAERLAQSVVQRTANNMRLEAQGNSQKRLKQAVQERTATIKNEMPRMLWDLR